MRSTMPLDDAAAVTLEAEVTWTMVPERTEVIAGFMAQAGRLPHRPASWKNCFFPEIHGLPGN